MKWKEYLFAPVLFLYILINGCSFIGYYIGGKIEDDRVFDANSIKFIQIDSTENISIITNNERMITGKLIDYSEITKNQFNNLLPLETNFNIRTQLHGGVHFDYSIPIEDIKEIKIRDYNYYGLLGFAIGAAIDLVIFNEIIYQLGQMPNFDGKLN